MKKKKERERGGISLAGVIAVTPSSSSVSGQSVNLVVGVALREIVHRSMNEASQMPAAIGYLLCLYRRKGQTVSCVSSCPLGGVVAMGTFDDKERHASISVSGLRRRLTAGCHRRALFFIVLLSAGKMFPRV